MYNLEQILTDFLNELATELKANIPNATGKTADNITVEVNVVEDDVFGRIEGKIFAPDYIWTLEHGRGPTKNNTPSTPTLREAILEWIKIRGIVPKIKAKNPRKNSYSVEKLQESLSWAIATKIHNEGNRLYRAGGNSDRITGVINDDVLSKFVNEFGNKAAIVVLNNVVNRYV